MLVLKQTHGGWTRVRHGDAEMRVKVQMKNDQPYLVFDLPSQDFQVVRENAVVQDRR